MHWPLRAEHDLKFLWAKEKKSRYVEHMVRCASVWYLGGRTFNLRNFRFSSVKWRMWLILASYQSPYRQQRTLTSCTCALLSRTMYYISPVMSCLIPIAVWTKQARPSSTRGGNIIKDWLITLGVTGRRIIIKGIVPDSDWLSHIPSHCKILYKNTALTASQQHNCVSQTSCFKMSDFVVNFNILWGLSLDEWWKEMNRMEE